MNQRTAWLRVAQDICEQISTGQIQIGEQIPSQIQLRERHDVANGTVRQAINHLTAAGVLEGRPGLGVFVLRAPQASDLGPQKSLEDRVRDLELARAEHAHMIEQQAQTIDDLRAGLARITEAIENAGSATSPS